MLFGWAAGREQIVRPKGGPQSKEMDKIIKHLRMHRIQVVNFHFIYFFSFTINEGWKVDPPPPV